MKKINKLTKSIITIFVIAVMILSWGFGVLDIYAAMEYEPTIRMGSNDPMTREEFLAWSSQNGIRHINIEGSILPVGIFFNGNSGKSFEYGEITERILYVVHVPGVVSDSRIVCIQQDSATPTQNHLNAIPSSPVIFTERTPIHLSYDELTALMEHAPLCPMHTRSNISLPNQRLTESELAAWIDEYNEMGGASAFELAVVREINRVRIAFGLRPLAFDSSLMMSARLKTQEFGDLQYFNHHSPVHGTVTEAARMFGFEGLAGENITMSGSNSSGTPILRASPESVVEGMLASTKGHRELLLDPVAFSVGVGVFFSPNSRGATGKLSYSFYFAAKFGFE
jgi:uncharacterized protein YkwD